MLVQESLVEETLHYKDMHEYETLDELEETLSFCDLPLYSDHHHSEWEEDLSIQSQGSSSISSPEQDYFEFISQEPSPHSQPENIFFCGKLIPYKQPNPLENNSSQVVLKSNTQTNIKKKHPWGLFKWKFISTKRVHSKKSTTTLVQKRDQSQSKMYNGNKHEKGFDFSLHKMPILQPTSSGKARWHFLLFGISKLSSQVELKDIKTRQSYLQYSPPVLRSQNHNDKFSGQRNGSSGVSGLIRVLSCGGNHQPDTMVVASIR